MKQKDRMKILEASWKRLFQHLSWKFWIFPQWNVSDWCKMIPGLPLFLWVFCFSTFYIWYLTFCFRTFVWKVPSWNVQLFFGCHFWLKGSIAEMRIVSLFFQFQNSSFFLFFFLRTFLLSVSCLFTISFYSLSLISIVLIMAFNRISVSLILR